MYTPYTNRREQAIEAALQLRRVIMSALGRNVRVRDILAKTAGRPRPALTRGPRYQGLDPAGNSVAAAMQSICAACRSPARFAPSVLPAPKNSFREPLQATRPIQPASESC